MTGEWLSLSEVAKIIGVHPSTVRSWADKGRLPVHRTQGGHRRFRKSEIELWLQAHREAGGEDTSQLLQSAIGRVRLQISDGSMGSETWYQKLDSEARNQYRRTSRSLVLGLASNVGPDDQQAASEARALGAEYASLGRRYGLTSLEALHAFLFFRNALLDSMIAVYKEATIRSPQAWGDMLRNFNTFTDQIMLKLLENYAVYERGNP